MSKIAFSAIVTGLRETETTAARHATELADEEHGQHNLALFKIAEDLDATVATAQTTAVAKRKDLHNYEAELSSLDQVSGGVDRAVRAAVAVDVVRGGGGGMPVEAGTQGRLRKPAVHVAWSRVEALTAALADSKDVYARA